MIREDVTLTRSTFDRQDIPARTLLQSALEWYKRLDTPANGTRHTRCNGLSRQPNYWTRERPTSYCKKKKT